MNRTLISAFLLACAATLAAQTPPSLQVRELTLKNGMTVWLNEDHSQPKVYGAVVVRAGAKDCPGTGIAHYFEHIMFKGTDRLGTTDYAAERPWLDSISAQYDLLAQTRDESQRTQIQQHINELSVKAAEYAIPNEFSRLVSRFGGSGLNAATGPDVTYYHNTFLPQYITQWCWLNSERLLHPVFRLFQAELENVYEEKNRAADVIGDAMEKVQRELFGNQPYGEPIIGTTESLKNPRLSEMEAFYKKYYVAPNMGLLLCGDLQADSLQDLLEATFGRVHTGPVPQRVKSPLPPTGQGRSVPIKLPIPLIKAVAQVSAAPTDFEEDALVLDLADGLLFNGKAGLLDSLMHEHVILAGMAGRMAFNDAGMQLLAVIPKLPFGKKQKAVDACRQQMERVKRGEFSVDMLEQLKAEALRDAEESLETIDDRAGVMLDAFSQGLSWQRVLQQMEQLRKVTKDDVVRVARKYFTDDYITFVKKFGIDNKETLKQPGYKPVEPKNAGAKSEFARELEQMPVDMRAIRTMDFDRDVQRVEVSPHVTLYAKENPLNDIFTFTLRFLNGKRHTPLLNELVSYLTELGTDSLSKQQLEKAWLQLGSGMSIEAGNDVVSFSLKGREAQLGPSLRLLSHFLQRAKADGKALKNLRQTSKVDYKSFGKQKDEVTQVLLQWVLYGEQSDYLRQTPLKTIEKTTSEELLALFGELQRYDCELLYSGRRTADEVAGMAAESLPLSRCVKAREEAYRRVRPVTEPVVYFYHVPKSRQDNVVSCQTLAPMPTWQQRVQAKLWDRYMGGGMSSVLFQNVREFRSLAYSTGGVMRMPDMVRHPEDSGVYITATGTQADKTLQAVQVVDSLLTVMPMKEENLEAARQELLSDVQNSYPTFRDMPGSVANYRLDGYREDPSKRVVELVPTVSAAEVVQFHRDNVAGQPRAWMVVGDRKLTDLKALEKFGKVVEVSKSDIFR